MNISNVEPLAVNSAETDSPLGRISPGELGDVLGRCPSHVGGALVVDLLHVHSELRKLGDHQLTPECLGDEDVALLQKPAVTASVNPSKTFCDYKVVY